MYLGFSGNPGICPLFGSSFPIGNKTISICLIFVCHKVNNYVSLKPRFNIKIGTFNAILTQIRANNVVYAYSGLRKPYLKFYLKIGLYLLTLQWNFRTQIGLSIMESYNSIRFGCYLVAYAQNAGHSMNVTKLMKLMYIIYGVYYTVTGQHIVEERPKAWYYGPVFENVWRHLRYTDFNSITLNNVAHPGLASDTNANACIDAVLDTFGDWSGNRLIRWTHLLGSPWWIEATKNGEEINDESNPNWGNVIDDNNIREYFRRILAANGQ